MVLWVKTGSPGGESGFFLELYPQAMSGAAGSFLNKEQPSGGFCCVHRGCHEKGKRSVCVIIRFLCVLLHPRTPSLPYVPAADFVLETLYFSSPFSLLDAYTRGERSRIKREGGESPHHGLTLSCPVWVASMAGLNLFRTK